MIIRTASLQDLVEVTKIEAICFPEAEAATMDSLKERLTYYPNHFWLIQDKNIVVGFVNGMVTDEDHLTDEMYENAKMHHENGKWQMIFGVDMIPSYRKQGYAGKMLHRVIEDAKTQGRKGLVLTCKEKKIPYYAKFGFVDEGLSKSEHGGAIWHEMRLLL